MSGVIANRSLEPDHVANATADLNATGVRFAITEAAATAEQRRLSRKRRRGSTERSDGRLRRPSK